MPNGATNMPMMPSIIQTRKVRHAAEHTVHVLDIAAADMMLGRAHAQEQQRLGHRVEQDQEDGGPYGLGRADHPSKH